MAAVSYISGMPWHDKSGIVALMCEGTINAVKRLAVSTGRLRRLLALHLRPIDLVVFQEPSFLRTGDLILRRVSRLYAFSVYPDRT